MRRPNLIAAVGLALVALGSTACGGSDESGFTTRGRPPVDPSEWTWGIPSSQMTDEAEKLIAGDKRAGSYASPECVPTKSLDGTGEFNFECTAQRGNEEVELQAIVFGSESGKPELGPIIVLRGQ
jgi:hypothetical protein